MRTHKGGLFPDYPTPLKNRTASSVRFFYYFICEHSSALKLREKNIVEVVVPEFPIIVSHEGSFPSAALLSCPVRIPQSAAPDHARKECREERRLRDLSGDIALKPGELRIEFYGAEDLAAKLLELSKAMENDWSAFARAVEDGGKEAAVST